LSHSNPPFVDGLIGDWPGAIGAMAPPSCVTVIFFETPL